MKKTMTFLVLFTTIVSVMLMVACGTSQSAMTEEQISEKLRYRPYTPANEIVEGKTTALNTITSFLKQEVVVGNDDYNTETKSDPVYDNEKVYLEYEVNNFNSNYRILYLYKDDTHICEATPTNETYISNGVVQPSIKDVSNGEVASWVFNGTAVAVLNESAGYRCSSIWGYDESQNKVKLLYCDSFDCPIWQSYYKN